jgi:hypothetical protein
VNLGSQRPMLELYEDIVLLFSTKYVSEHPEHKYGKQQTLPLCQVWDMLLVARNGVHSPTQCDHKFHNTHYNETENANVHVSENLLMKLIQSNTLLEFLEGWQIEQSVRFQTQTGDLLIMVR